MKEILLQLIALQGMDLELDAIDKSVTNEQEALDARSSELAKKEAKIAELEISLGDQEKEHRTLEAEVEDQMEHVRERQSKMMQVQTDREHTALLKEIEDAKKAAKDKEEKIVALMESSEVLKNQITEEKNILKGEKELLAEETEKTRTKIDEINKGRLVKDKAREEKAKEVAALDSNLMKKYKTLRRSRNGLAVINVEDGVCLGCYMAIPPQRYNMLLRGDQLLECPGCQRLIYYRPNLD